MRHGSYSLAKLPLSSFTISTIKNMNVLKMTSLNLRNKRVLIREDLNVPMKNGEITDDTRIRASLPTIRYALDAGAHVILLSHLGRPEEGAFDASLSLAPIANRLSELLGRQVPLVRNWLGGIDVAPGQATRIA